MKSYDKPFDYGVKCLHSSFLSLFYRILLDSTVYCLINYFIIFFRLIHFRRVIHMDVCHQVLIFCAYTCEKYNIGRERKQKQEWRCVRIKTASNAF